MKNYAVTLKSAVSDSFRCTKAANSLDIDQHKKAVHHFEVEADLESPFSIGLIVGASGSGKTTLINEIYGIDSMRELLDLQKPVIEQFHPDYSYEECAAMLAGVGLTAVMCWIRPAYTLSNGQRVRAELALRLSTFRDDDDNVVVMDEWTSVVDRTVAKVMSHCIQKHARKFKRRVVLASCHYDVIEWLNPDWIIDCNKSAYVERRSLCRSSIRQEKLRFDIRRVDRQSWRYFSKYHYLSDKLPGGHIETFGLFCGDDQIGFQCFANYVPCRRGKIEKMHSNRTVIHPDYAGLGMGIKLINETSKIMCDTGYDVWAKFSSTPVYLAMRRQPCWEIKRIERKTKTVIGGNMMRDKGFRQDVKTYSFRFNPRNFPCTT